MRRGRGHIECHHVEPLHAGKVRSTQPLAEAIQADPLARQDYGRPPLREVLLLPEGAQPPATKYLDWHRQKIFAA